jgi:hypothetical protein
MFNSRAFVNDDNPSGLKLFDNFSGTISCSFDNLDTFIDDDLGVGLVVRWYDGGEEYEVYSEGLASHCSTSSNLFVKILFCKFSRSSVTGVGFEDIPGVGWASPVNIPKPPAFDTPDESSAYPTHCIPACMTGTGKQNPLMSSNQSM